MTQSFVEDIINKYDGNVFSNCYLFIDDAREEVGASILRLGKKCNFCRFVFRY